MARGISGNGKSRENTCAGNGPVLDLAPLERDCMNMLWPVGEATVRDIRDALAEIRPRAYTTIMTIMDRLAHKGVVERRKVGKAYVYRPNLTEEQARARAVEQLVENYFDGSRAGLTDYLEGDRPAVRRAAARREIPAERQSEAEAVPGAAEVSMDDTLL